MRDALAGHDAVAQLATQIPVGAAAARRSAWRTNDQLRGTAAAIIAEAAIANGVDALIQESITLPYVDNGDRWIDEHVERAYVPVTESVVDAEAAAAAMTAAGRRGVVLRFAMFMGDGSGHIDSFVAAARRGIFAVFGAPGAYTSFVHIDDAAAAVVAALDVPAGVYNVAEPDPQRRAAHNAALAAAVDRKRLRPVPRIVERAGGKSAAGLARSQRISSQLLQSVSPWRPVIHCIDQWKELA